MPTKLPTRHKVRHEKSVRVKETKSGLALRPSSGRSVARRGRTRRPIDALCHSEREGRVRDEKRGGEMPVTISHLFVQLHGGVTVSAGRERE